MVGSSPCSNATDPARLSGLMVDRPISLTSIIARVVAGLMPAFCANSAGASSRVPETTGKKPRISPASRSIFYRVLLLQHSAEFGLFRLLHLLAFGEGLLAALHVAFLPQQLAQRIVGSRVVGI